MVLTCFPPQLKEPLEEACSLHSHLFERTDNGKEPVNTFIKRLLTLDVFVGSAAYNLQTLPFLFFRPKGRVDHIAGSQPVIAFGSPLPLLLLFLQMGAECAIF